MNIQEQEEIKHLLDQLKKTCYTDGVCTPVTLNKAFQELEEIVNRQPEEEKK